MINFLYLFLAFIADIGLGILFPTAFVGFNISATPNILLIVLILITYKEDVLKSILLGFFVGLSVDIFNPDTIYTYATIYMLTTLVVSAWSTRINDSFVELFLVTLSAVFFKELLVYMSNVIGHNYILNFGNWGALHLLFTILFSLLPIIIAVFVKLNSIDVNVKHKQRSKRWD